MSKYWFQFGLFDRFWSHFWTQLGFGHFLVTILETFLDTFWSHFWTLNGHIFGQIWGLEKKFGHFFDHILVTILDTLAVWTFFGFILVTFLDTFEFGHFLVTF